jgi:cytochrome P450
VVGGYDLPRHQQVLLSPYVTHRHPDFWPEPERFDPERFRPGMEATRPKYAYFPFGGGPRRCIGSDFAVLESVIVLATVAQRYRLRLVPGHPVVPEPLITLRPKFGLRMHLEPRRSRPSPGPKPVAVESLPSP